MNSKVIPCENKNVHQNKLNTFLRKIIGLIELKQLRLSQYWDSSIFRFVKLHN